MLKYVYFSVLLIALAQAKPKAAYESLYGSEDNVTILTGDNFNQTIFNSPYIWLVEFYSSWCGHCQMFAPIYKAFAKDIAEWHSVFRIAVINCPDYPNREICHGLALQAYPELRMFHPFSNHRSGGLKVEGNSVNELRNTSLRIIVRHLDEVRWNLPNIEKPTFKFISYNDIVNFFKNKFASHYLAIVVENKSSDMGKQIILDMSSCTNITTRRFDSTSRESQKLASFTGLSIKNFPTVILLTKDGKAKEIEVKVRDRSFYTYKLQNMSGVGDPKSLLKQSITLADESEHSVDWKTVDRGKVYVADIEAGLRYALDVEIGSVNVLQGETLDAAKTFIGTLALLSEKLPVRKTTKKFIVKLTGWLAGMVQIDHMMWKKRINTEEVDNYLPPASQKWVGCAPSKPSLRGYPCSLWTLFHALTVASYNENEHDFLRVPQAMEAYILNFFSCLECRKNFVKELIDVPYDDKLKSNKDVVLWLWELHNKVNKRLHGAISEDPNIPKIQFPSTEFCPNCIKTQGEWNRDNVFDYIVEKYSVGKVSYEFLEKVIVQPNPPVEKNVGISNHRSVSYDHFGMNFEVQAKFDDQDFDAGDRNYDPRIAVAGNGHPQLVKEFLVSKRKQHPLDILKEFGGDKDSEYEFIGRWHNTRVEPSFSYFDTSFCFFLWGTSMFMVGLFYFYMNRRKIPKRCMV